MVKVNLLRPGSGDVKKAIVLNFGAGRLQKILFLISIILLVIGALLMFYTYYLKKNLYQINSQYKEAEKIEEEIRILAKEKDKLSNGIDFLSGYLKREIIWSEKLHQMPALIPQEAWLIRLNFEKKPGSGSNLCLNLTGGLMPKGNTSPIGVLSNFVNQLKENKEFSQDFDTPVLADLRSEQRSGAEVMIFSIEMPLRKNKVVSPK